MEKYIALDIGGTSIKYGIVDEDGHIIYLENSPTEAEGGGKHVINKAILLIEEMLKHYPKAKGIGISTAGQVCPDTGIILHATDNIPDYINTPVEAIIREYFHLPVKVENDVNAAALGELWQGCGKDSDSFICITIGTGIGGAIIQSKRLFYGTSGIAGEFGHIVIKKNGRLCSCGQRGCFEQYASTKALIQDTKSMYKKAERNIPDVLNGETIFELSKKNNTICGEAIENFAQNIALGLTSIIYVLNPNKIIIGGGISAQGDYLLDKIKKYVVNSTMPSFTKDLSIEFASCKNHAGMLGAVYSLLKRR